MRHFLSVLLCWLLLLTVLSGCGITQTSSENTHSTVVIHQPDDNSVNGYRKSANAKTSSGSETMPEKIYTEETPVQPGSVSISAGASARTVGADTAACGYCGNKNSKTFHRSDCSSVKKMKEENKVVYPDRNTYISEGYKPCSRCNP